MADICCEQFDLVAGDPRATLMFRSRLSAAPAAGWKKMFMANLATENAIGNGPAARFLQIEGAMIQFQADEATATASAEVIRRVMDKTNREAAKGQAEMRERQEAQAKAETAERQRLKEKFKGGI